MNFIEADIKAEQKKLKQRKQDNMKAKTTTPKTKATPKTIKVSTLVKAAAIVLAIIASFVAGIYTANAYDAMIDTEAEARATALLKSDGKQ